MATAKLFPVTASSRSFIERHPDLPEELPITLITEILTDAINRPPLPNRKGVKIKNISGLRIYLQKVNNLHLFEKREVRVVGETVRIRVDYDGKLTIIVGDFGLSPYTLTGAIAFYEWLYRSWKHLKEGKPYGQPLECEFHKFEEPHRP